ncbi:DUF3253 domain-containing protein [Luteimonas sp. FCS-9]|uniref:DUF3253 domain-containing protein n=1 Tax=Luteimonas sp. FCS-9 TaxID=1547516 RepID=UPI00063E9251|nr:DUF3253 domain-containing protein [Luteimonas sp. FCS-9]KLJ00625.1 hypothetical protein WQ56_09415 [Luteimonas sp. FCS-9]
MAGEGEAAVLRARILALLATRTAEASICPSEVARALRPGGDWRALMPAVRNVAATLAHAGTLEITQRGAVVDPDAPPPGPVRLRRGPRWSASG